MLPRDDRYVHRHGARGHGGDHLLPALVSPSLVLPVDGGELVLGTWQSIVIVDPNRDNDRRPQAALRGGDGRGRDQQAPARLALAVIGVADDDAVPGQPHVLLRRPLLPAGGGGVGLTGHLDAILAAVRGRSADSGVGRMRRRW